MILTKERISELKNNNLSELYKLLHVNIDNRQLLFTLENLGFLPENFNGEIFIPLINHQNSDIRFWAVKNIGKIPNITYLELLFQTAKHDIDSMVRREAVSSIGRMRLKEAESMLISFLDDLDPKVVLQAIRGLLVFKDDKSISSKLIDLQNHPNEMIQSVIKREFFADKKILPSILIQ